MYKYILIFLISTSVSCQTDFGKLTIESSLHNDLVEVSGIEYIDNTKLIWMVEDSGNEAKIFGYNPKTKNTKTIITVTNAENNDWEDLASDKEGNLYIGDFGNNSNKRKHLTIYKISNGDLFDKKEVKATKIEFKLEDQEKFPPKKKNRNFDIESFFVLNNNFYLVSRNRSSKFDGTAKLYKLSMNGKEDKANVVSSFKTCEDKTDCQITSATINHTTGEIVLLSYDKIWVLTDYKQDNIFEGSVKEINLDHFSQKESITFLNSKLYIVDEKIGIGGSNVYFLEL
ncbi:hypothetical protein [Patiriisocius hiemis]|uniref:Uncharacterized protein n=1 Tax=Patiriisocius hiemis TaxID=3075604 RepID=A0ABU2YFI2_9FLAO|nr:hypothetical protein [Constantimarinum sp. W242]MDT0556631.1 hypothetical protein [Constantimarinum sp. W242]